MIELQLDKTRVSEIETILSIENDRANRPYIFPNSEEEHLAMITDNDVEHLVIRSETEEIIGLVILAGLTNNNRSIELKRIVVTTKGAGIGRKTLQEIKHHCFTKLKCHRLWLDVLETNNRARHLYQSEGFIEEGILRESILFKENFIGLLIMSILESEYTIT